MFVNLSKIPNMQVFCLYVIICCRTHPLRSSGILTSSSLQYPTCSIKSQTSSSSFKSSVRNILLHVLIKIGLEIIRISDGEPLELELQMVVSTADIIWEIEHPGQYELFVRIMEKGTPLSPAGLSKYLKPYFSGWWI